MNKATEESLAMGVRIQQARRMAKLTQMQFSEMIGVSTQYISDLERGIVGCSIQTLLKICDTLNVSTDFVLRGFEPEAGKMAQLLKCFGSLSPQRQEIIYKMCDLLDEAFSSK